MNLSTQICIPFVEEPSKLGYEYRSEESLRLHDPHDCKDFKPLWWRKHRCANSPTKNASEAFRLETQLTLDRLIDR